MRNTSKKSTLPHNIRWGQLNWLQIKRYVERMQQRIYRAESLGNKRKVRNLQRILIRSKSVLLLAIKRVTQANKGKKTAGIDGETALTGTERIELYKAMAGKNIWNHRPKPSRRTYIKKKNGKLRPLSIPTIKDRIYQHTFGTIIHFLRNLHPKKSMKWMRQKYFKPDKAGQSKDRWILTEPNEGRQLAKMAWTPIIRHPLIKFKASPYDTDLKEYFEERDRKEFNRNCVKSRQKLAKRQNYKCPICEMSITNFHEKLTVIEKSSDNRKYENLELVHKICQKYRDKMIPSSNLLSPKEVKECYKEIKRMRLAEVVV